jgi:hypothetical protein
VERVLKLKTKQDQAFALPLSGASKSSEIVFAIGLQIVHCLILVQ